MFKLVKRICIKVCQTILFFYTMFGLSVFTSTVYLANRTLGVICMFLLAMTFIYFVTGGLEND